MPSELMQAQQLSRLDAQGATASVQANFIGMGPSPTARSARDSEEGGLPSLFGRASPRYWHDSALDYRHAVYSPWFENGTMSVGLLAGRGMGAEHVSAAPLVGADTAVEQHTQQQIAGAAFVGARSAGGEFKGVPAVPVRALLAVFQRWDIPDQLAAVMLGAADADIVTRLRSSASSLRTRDELDRMRLIINIYEGVFSLLRDPNSEKAWIRMPRSDFDGLSLLDLMTEGSQRNLIRVLAFVDYVNGR
jgi:hypothetical protein